MNTQMMLSDDARRAYARFERFPQRAVNGNDPDGTPNADLLAPYRELRDAGLVTETPLPENWFEYVRTNMRETTPPRINQL